MKYLLLLFASAKLGKILLSASSMLFTIWVYAALYGFPFAAGFVGMLLVHEMGHYVAAKQRGLDVGLPAFIPFVGAWINLREQPPDADTEAYVAYAGPFVGTIASFAAYFWARSTGSDLWLAVSYSGFLINLINLIPVSPLDGGRITQVLSPRIWFFGVPMLALLFFYSPSPMLIVIGILALPNLLAAWRYDPNSPDALAYRSIPDTTKYEYAFMYLGLSAVLALMTYEVHQALAHT